MPRILIEREERLRKGKISHEILHLLRERPIALPAYKRNELNSFLLPKLEERGIGRRRKNSVRVALDRLRRQRYVDYNQTETRATLLITESGKKRLFQYDIENLALEKNRKWDQVWRIVMFDIPEDLKRARDAISHKLKALGFYKVQKSVFAHHLSCLAEVEFLGEFFGVSGYVTLIETRDLGNHEKAARRFFDIS